MRNLECRVIGCVQMFSIRRCVRLQLASILWCIVDLRKVFSTVIENRAKVTLSLLAAQAYL